MISQTVSKVQFEDRTNQTAPASQSEEIRKLNFLPGEWKSKGWVVSWDGSHGDEFSQKTKVQAKSDGSILRIKDERRYNTPGVIQQHGQDYHRGD